MKDIWRQVLLHLPQFTANDIRYANQMPPRLSSTVEKRLTKANQSRQSYLDTSKSTPLLFENWKVYSSQLHLRSDCGQSLQYTFNTVPESIGLHIESNLHYMQSPSRVARFRFGMFLEGTDHPFCYLSCAPLDRAYKVRCLEESLNQKVDPHLFLNICRIWGIGNLPTNTISVLISWVANELRQLGYRFLLTAVNPMLGFTASSTLASGFAPYSLAPVAYGYDASGSYTTRRNGALAFAKLSTPPNILFINGTTKQSRAIVSSIRYVSIVNVQSQQDFWEDSFARIAQSDATDSIFEKLRRDLEKAWNNLTRYHRTTVSPDDSISKGQCGVTSAFIARELHRKGFHALFCEGDVIFPRPTNPIRNHCWVRIPRFPSGQTEIEDLIIDLTSDQSGFAESVICEDDHSLRERGIEYKEVRAVKPRHFIGGHLSHRLDILQARIKEIKSKQA